MLNYLFKSLLKVQYTQAKFSTRGFYQGDANAIIQLESIGSQFLNGYHYAISGGVSYLLDGNIPGIAPEGNGFYYEGAAMGNCIRDGLGIFKKNRLKKLIDHPQGNKHIYMLHVGAGWAFARLPFSIEKKMKGFDQVLRWLIMDGYGFHQAYFKTKKYIIKKQLPKELKEAYSINVFYQGVGRCLWFVECANPQRIAERINGFPAEYQAGMWSGIGLASTYAGGVDETEILLLKKLSGNFLPHLAQGAVFAVKARERAEIITRHTETACKIICGMPVSEAASIADYFYTEIPTHLSSSEKYEWWRAAIRNLFIKTKTHEPVIEEIFS